MNTTNRQHTKPDAATDVKIKVVNEHLAAPKASLVEPKSSGFIHLAAEIDRVWPFGIGPVSRAKRDTVARATTLAGALEELDAVVSAKVLVARFIVPGQAKRLDDRADVHPARFDLSVLIETVDGASAAELQSHDRYGQLVAALDAHSRYTHIVRASNACSLGEVDMSRDGVFLFNYFYADDPAVLIPVWEYTAGWFQAKTGLDNSTLLVPVEGEQSQYGIINNCRWDHWHDILPALRFRPSFRKFVLANFYANGIVPMAILYRLAPGSEPGSAKAVTR
jgi:hypothetical protein